MISDRLIDYAHELDIFGKPRTAIRKPRDDQTRTGTGTEEESGSRERTSIGIDHGAVNQ